MPMTLIIITGEIDLSVASIAGLTSALMGVLWAGGMDIWLVLAISLLAGIAAGMFNGFLIAVLGLPSLAVTIGTLALFRGLALVIIGDNAVANFPKALTAFFTSKIGGTGIPTVMIGVVVVMVFFGVLLHFTPFGRGLFAIGYSKEAASFVGINVARSKFWLYVGIRRRLGPGRHLLDAALHERPQRQRLRPGTGRHRRRPAGRRVDLRRQGLHPRRHRRRPADRDAQLRPPPGPGVRRRPHHRDRAAADRLGRGAEHRLRHQAMAPHPARPPKFHPQAPPEICPLHHTTASSRTGGTDRTRKREEQ